MLLGSRPLRVSFTVNWLPVSVSCAVPFTVSPLLAGGADCNMRCTDCAAEVDVFELATSAQTMGRNWSVVLRPGPLCTFTYHPVDGMPFVIFLTTVVADATPCASAINVVSG